MTKVRVVWLNDLSSAYFVETEMFNKLTGSSLHKYIFSLEWHS